MHTHRLISAAVAGLFTIVIAAAAAPAARTVRVWPSGATVTAARAEPLYIVQAASVSAARESLARVDGRVFQELQIINAVAARLSPEQVSRLRKTSAVRVFDDRAVATRGLLDSLTAPL